MAKCYLCGTSETIHRLDNLCEPCLGEQARVICSGCDTELTAENTQNYKGFDAGSYVIGKPYNALKSWFIKCDDCFDRAIDNHLENQYN